MADPSRTLPKIATAWALLVRAVNVTGPTYTARVAAARRKVAATTPRIGGV